MSRTIRRLIAQASDVQQQHRLSLCPAAADHMMAAYLDAQQQQQQQALEGPFPFSPGPAPQRHRLQNDHLRESAQPSALTNNHNAMNNVNVSVNMNNNVNITGSHSRHHSP
jgi:hypothetical protein